MSRANSLVTGQIYHVMNKSIAGYIIFGSRIECIRMKQMLNYYAIKGSLSRFCFYLDTCRIAKLGFDSCFVEDFKNRERKIRLLAYCIMPTHIHLVVQQLCDCGIKSYMSNLLNSYTRYFNLRHKRKGPLWVGRFKNVRVESDEQLLHLTRYVHLNPVSADLTKNAKDWEFSSIAEYVDPKNSGLKLCQFKDLIDMTPKSYLNFVNDYADFQKELAIIKRLSID